VRIGDPVAEGEPVIILESMKMEFPVTCPKDGIVESLTVEEGQMVVEGQLLGTIATL
jgi:biotin carboxyl carrier protein